MAKISQDVAPVLYNMQCKVCQMAKTHPELFKELHIQVLEYNISMNRAMINLNAKIDTDSIQLTKFNAPNMQAHFTNHISLPERVHIELSKSGSIHTGKPELKHIAPEMGYFIEDLVRRKVGTEVSDYLNLDQLRLQITDKMELLDSVIEKKVNGNTEIDTEAMGLFVKLVAEIRNCIVDLNKIRQGKQLMNAMIKSLIEKYTFQVARELTSEYDQLYQSLLQIEIIPVTALRIVQELKLTAARIVANTARDAVNDILMTYKL